MKCLGGVSELAQPRYAARLFYIVAQVRRNFPVPSVVAFRLDFVLFPPQPVTGISHLVEHRIGRFHRQIGFDDPAQGGKDFVHHAVHILNRNPFTSRDLVLKLDLFFLRKREQPDSFRCRNEFPVVAGRSTAVNRFQRRSTIVSAVPLM